MGSLFGGMMGGGGKSQQADWGQIEKLMNMQADLNRYDQYGLFTNMDWTENPDGTWDQKMSANPEMAGAMSNLMQAASGPREQYQSPPQFSQMLDAKMANQMGRQDILQPGAAPQPQTPFGPPSAERPGMPQQQPPQSFGPPQPPPGQPPQGGPPPGAGAGGPPPQQQGPSPQELMKAKALQAQNQAGRGQQQGQGGGGQWEMMQKLMGGK